ncbi:hypothetical protein AB0J86_37745 [Micromonospora sp. NPDC049559]|uniref:hypothetical protein n=1 Tax=Micromonospora sp. NPDC049559 TaxID=3155923 RepID=UPI003440563C
MSISTSVTGLRGAAVALGLAAAAATAVAAAAPATAAAATNATVAQDPADASGFVIWRGEGVRIRACASTSCTVLGLGYSSHVAGWYCQEVANGFAHIHNFTTGVDGWVSTSLIYYGCD